MLNRRWIPLVLLFVPILLLGPGARADEYDSFHGEPVEGGPDVVVSLGAAISQDFTSSQLQAGLNFATETNIIEDWLDIELGFRILSISGGPVSVPVDFLAKKPFHLTEQLQLMVGVGPEVVRDFGTGASAQLHVGAEFVATLMAWPWSSKTFGLYVSPLFEFVERDSAHFGLGSTAGVLFRM